LCPPFDVFRAVKISDYMKAKRRGVCSLYLFYDDRNKITPQARIEPPFVRILDLLQCEHPFQPVAVMLTKGSFAGAGGYYRQREAGELAQF